MTSNTIALLLLFFSFFFFTPYLSDTPPSAPVTPTTACNSTPDPNFCKSVLPPQGAQTMYTYGRFSLAKSLLNAQKFLNLINNYLVRRSTLSLTAIQALDDCQFLSQLNIDFLTSAGVAFNSTNNMLDPQADMLQTLLSALLTNQQTCLVGIQVTASALSIKNSLTVPLSNGTKFYSVSLALFTKAWVPKKQQGQVSSSRPGRSRLHGTISFSLGGAGNSGLSKGRRHGETWPCCFLGPKPW